MTKFHELTEQPSYIRGKKDNKSHSFIWWIRKIPSSYNLEDTYVKVSD